VAVEGLGQLKLAGKLYQLQAYEGLCVWCEHYAHKVLQDAGLDKAVLPLDGEDGVAWTVRLQSALEGSMMLPKLLGAFLLPVDTLPEDWTPAIAAQTERHIQRMTAKEDKATIHAMALDVVMGFFRGGVDLLGDFPRSSSEIAAPPERASGQSGAR
jgi:hypothetical protein